jgi:hypothetical protein
MADKTTLEMVHGHRNYNSWHRDYIIEVLCRYIDHRGVAGGLDQFLENADDESDPEDTGNAGCDECGMFDRVAGSRLCKGCLDDAEDSNPIVATDGGTDAGTEPGPR